MTDYNEEDQDLNQETETLSDQSNDHKPSPEEEEPLKKQGEEENESSSEDSSELSKDEQLREMLSDGTPADKDITVKKDKYDEANEKAKLYDAFAPVLAKLKDSPDLLDKLTREDDGETVEARVKRLEQEKLEDKRKETERVLSDALEVWPDLRKYWEQIKPLAQGLENQGVSYAESLQRAYFAVNPNAVEKDNRLIQKAEQMQNESGSFSSSQGSSKVIHEDTGSYPMTEEDKEFAKSMGISESLYHKHSNHLKALNL